MSADCRADAAAAAVTQQGDVLARGQSFKLMGDAEDAEFHEVIAAATGSQLCPGPVFAGPGNRADRPVPVQDVVMSPFPKFRADTESGLRLDCFGQAVLFAFQIVRGNIRYGHFHAAGYIDTDGIGNDGIFRGQNPSDGKPVTGMSIGHEGSGNRDRQPAGILHLIDSRRLEILPPLAVADRFGPGTGRFHQGLGQV